MFWKSKKSIERDNRETDRRRKIAASQLALLEAATTTADVAYSVTSQLKKHLEDSVKQFETTMKIINDALVICDEAGVIRASNPAAEKIFSCFSHDILFKNIRTLFSTTSSENFWEELSKDTTKGLRQNGEAFPIDVKIEQMSKADNSLVYLVLVRDITNLIALKRTSKEFEQRYHILFDQCIDAIIILQDGEVVASNAAAHTILNSTMKVENFNVPPGEIIELNDTSGNIEFILSGATITWNDRNASLITIKDIRGLRPLDTKSKNPNNVDMIVCFDKNYKTTFVNDQFCKYYNKSKSVLLGNDIRQILNQTELATFLVSINSLSVDGPLKRIQVHVEKNGGMVLQDWVDYASFENGELVEYQRTGRDITDVLNTLTAK